MKFIKKQIVHTTVVDEDVIDKNTIYNIFQAVLKSNIYVSLTYKDSRSFNIKNCPRTRVISATDSSIDICAYNNSSSLTTRGIKYEDIIALNVSTELHNINLGKDVSRFDFIDIGN